MPARLQIVGTGTQDLRLQALAATLGISGRVTFAGRVADAELAAAFRGSDLFCMPGTAELQSLATLEAMPAGKPVVAANAMALPHLVHDGQNGYLYEPGDAQSLTSRLAALLTQPALRRQMGCASKTISQQHAVDHTLDAFENHYTELRSRLRRSQSGRHGGVVFRKVEADSLAARHAGSSTHRQAAVSSHEHLRHRRTCRDSPVERADRVGANPDAGAGDRCDEAARQVRPVATPLN